jgi:hypothetical protein
MLEFSNNETIYLKLIRLCFRQTGVTDLFCFCEKVTRYEYDRKYDILILYEKRRFSHIFI